MATPDYIDHTSISLVIFGDFLDTCISWSMSGIGLEYWTVGGGWFRWSSSMSEIHFSTTFFLEYIPKCQKYWDKNLGLRSWHYTKYLIKSFVLTCWINIVDTYLIIFDQIICVKFFDTLFHDIWPWLDQPGWQLSSQYLYMYTENIFFHFFKN